MIVKNKGVYQRQINSYNYPNHMLPIGNLITLENEYIERIGIFAPPGSQFRIIQGDISTEIIDIEIGSTFMYEAFNTYITGIQYLGHNDNYKINEEIEYTIPATRNKRIVIDFITKER